MNEVMVAIQLLMSAASPPPCDSLQDCLRLVDRLAQAVRTLEDLPPEEQVRLGNWDEELQRHLDPLVSRETPLASRIASLATEAPGPAVCGLVKVAEAWFQLGWIRQELAFPGSQRAAAASGHMDCDFTGLAEQEAGLRLHNLAFATALHLDVFGECRDKAFRFNCRLRPSRCVARQERDFMVADDLIVDLEIRTATSSGQQGRRAVEQAAAADVGFAAGS